MKYILFVIFVGLMINYVFGDSSSPKNLVYIQGMDEYNREDLVAVKEILEKYYDFEYKIVDQPYITGRQVLNTKSIQIDRGEPIGLSPDFNKPITIFVTTKKITNPLYPRIKGITFGNTIYITARSKFETQKIALHEMMHNYGVTHCKNNCVMNVPFKKTIDGNFVVCDDCAKKANFKFSGN